MDYIVLQDIKVQDAVVNEAYKQLRTNIMFSGDDIKTIAITSCQPNEGKSSTAFQLACAFAEINKRVAYVDADIRNSVFKKKHKVKEQVNGLSHVLSGQVDLRDALYKTNLANLYTIFSGPQVPNPAELLQHKRFLKMINSLKEHMDIVIVDCPPLGLVIDAAIIARHVDGSILVVESNAVSRKNVRRVKAQLEKSGCRILGAVMTKVEEQNKGKYGDSNYYGYGGKKQPKNEPGLFGKIRQNFSSQSE